MSHYKNRPPFVIVNARGKETLSESKLAETFQKKYKYIIVGEEDKEDRFVYIYEDGYYKLLSGLATQTYLKEMVCNYNRDLVNITQLKRAYEDIIRVKKIVDSDRLNSDENLVNFQNGLLSINENKLVFIPHSADILSTIRIPCDWQDKKIPTPIFDKYLDDLTEGNDEVKQLLLEFMGAIIGNFNGQRLKKALVLVGLGNTGKSKLKKLVESIIGKNNHTAIDLAELETPFGMINLHHKRLAGTSDMSFKPIQELKNLKRLTGDDTVYADNKFKAAISLDYKGLLWFCGNRLPYFSGDDGSWVWDRLLIVHCNNVIPDAQQDKYLVDKMYNERAGIVHKAIVAAQQIIRNGYRFSIPQCVQEIQKKYQLEYSTVLTFLSECMQERTEDDKIPDGCTTGRIYNVYKQWCINTGNRYFSMSEFRNKIALHYNTTYENMIVRRSDGTYFKMLTLNKVCKIDYDDVLYG